MRGRALFAGAVGALLVAVAVPAAAKVAIAKAYVSGPGLEGGRLRISGPAAEGMWGSGIDMSGGLDDTMTGSVEELGLTSAALGPRYIVTYRLHAGTKAAEVVRQDLYPYAESGPVTYTPPGQLVAEGRPWGGAISSGWHQSSVDFFDYLVDQGLPETNPVDADGASGRAAVPATGPTLSGWIVLAVAGLLGASVAVPRLRRRVLAVARAHRGPSTTCSPVAPRD